jgi:transposase
MHARIVLKADEDPGGPAWSDDLIVEALEVSRSTVERVRTRCVEEGPDAALRPRQSRQLRLRKLDGAREAHLIAVACSPAPQGRKRWTLRLLADKLVELDIVNGVSYETVRRTLKKSHGAARQHGGMKTSATRQPRLIFTAKRAAGRATDRARRSRPAYRH